MRNARYAIGDKVSEVLSPNVIGDGSAPKVVETSIVKAINKTFIVLENGHRFHLDGHYRCIPRHNFISLRKEATQ